MKQGKELRTKALVNSPRFNYLPDEDRYLVAKTQAEYKFNVIGAGINGQEHINITYLEGRAMIHGVYDPNPRSVMVAQEIQTQWGQPELIVYDSLEAACNDPEVDALLICTPNHTHLDVVNVAAQSEIGRAHV